MRATPAIAWMLLAAACSSGSDGVQHDVSVQVERVALDPVVNTPVIILGESAGSRQLPIWIGLAEARSIAQRLEDVKSPRPNTHDLASRLIEGLEGRVERVTVTALRDGTYYAVIQLERSGSIVEIDARPSDAIALALRTGAPVFVREPLFEQSKRDSIREALPPEENI
jgi:bifunctional DNase/RNase